MNGSDGRASSASGTIIGPRILVEGMGFGILASVASPLHPNEVIYHHLSPQS